MKAYWMVSEAGGARLEAREVDQPQPGPGQLLVKVRAASLNRGEFVAGHGLHAPGSAKPAGMEAAGEVVQAGEGVTGWNAGDRVMARCPGAFAEYALVDQREAMRVPARLSWEEAGSVPLTFLVTHDLLVLQGRLQAGEWLLVNGVTSGVGVASLQMAKVLGARVIGTSGSQDKLARLKPLGLDVALHTRAPDFLAPVKEATAGKGVNLVVNTVGGSQFAEGLRCLAFQGRMGIVGYVDGQLEVPLDLLTLHSQRLVIFGVSNKLRTPEQRAEGLAKFAAQMLPAFDDGRITPLIDRVFGFDELPAARAHMESNQHVGKLVLAVGG